MLNPVLAFFDCKVFLDIGYFRIFALYVGCHMLDFGVFFVHYNPYLVFCILVVSAYCWLLTFVGAIFRYHIVVDMIGLENFFVPVLDRIYLTDSYCSGYNPYRCNWGFFGKSSLVYFGYWIAGLV